MLSVNHRTTTTTSALWIKYMNIRSYTQNHTPLETSQIEDIKLAASKMTGANRRAFLADMAIKYCDESPRKTETIFGWSRHTVELGLHEKSTGIICLSAHSPCSGRKLWEVKYPEPAEFLLNLADSYSQQDPTFKTTILYTRLTAAEAIKQLYDQGFNNEVIPSPSTMAEFLNRNGYKLKPVIKAKPFKKKPETDLIFDNIKQHDEQRADNDQVKRISIDCKATVNIGEYSRGGKTRGNNKAADHDMGCVEKYTPFGVIDESDGQLHVFFGNSAKTSDFIVDSLHIWWRGLLEEDRNNISLIQIKVDNGPECSGRRTQFLKRIVEFTDHVGVPVHLLYYPPYHSKYNPIERCWGILEKHWNGALLTDVSTMLSWAMSMTWKGIHPIVDIFDKVYEKGIALSKKAMQEIEKRLDRNPALSKWDIFITPI